MQLCAGICCRNFTLRTVAGAAGGPEIKKTRPAHGSGCPPVASRMPPAAARRPTSAVRPAVRIAVPRTVPAVCLPSPTHLRLPCRRPCLPPVPPSASPPPRTVPAVRLPSPTCLRLSACRLPHTSDCRPLIHARRPRRRPHRRPPRTVPAARRVYCRSPSGSPGSPAALSPHARRPTALRFRRRHRRADRRYSFGR